jgi:post-segregation antitoxin (ccd killing protein)
LEFWGKFEKKLTTGHAGKSYRRTRKIYTQIHTREPVPLIIFFREKTTVTIPRWLKEAAEAEGLNYSRLLETAIKETLGVAS